MDTLAVTASADTDTEGLLLYDLDIGHGKALKVVSDPCHKCHTYCCGNSLWTACIEFVGVLAGSSALAFVNILHSALPLSFHAAVSCALTRPGLPTGTVMRKRVLELGAGLGVLGQVRRSEHTKMLCPFGNW